MASDRYYWKALDQAKYASNPVFQDVHQTMLDVHRRVYDTFISDGGVLLNGLQQFITVAQRDCKVVGCKFTASFNAIANDADYADIRLWHIRNGVVIDTILEFTTQTTAFAGPPWGSGTLSSGVPFDPIAYGVANPTKLMLNEQVNLILKGDLLAWQVFKAGAGITFCTAAQPALVTLDLEEI